MKDKMNPTDYKGFHKKVAEWRGESLRFFSKREINEQKHDTKPSEGRHLDGADEPKNWTCCNQELMVRDSSGNLEKCSICKKTYNDTFYRKLTLKDFL
jgi:hypothetical protein